MHHYFFSTINFLLLDKPVRVFESARISSVNFFGRNSFSGKNEKLDVDGAIFINVFVTVVGDVTVASGRAPIPDVESTGTINDGFLINDKNKCSEFFH